MMSSVKKQYYGVASSSIATMRTIGMTLSMAITSIMLALYMGKAEITPAIYPAFSKSIKFSFLIFTILSAIGIYFSFTRGNIEREE